MAARLTEQFGEAAGIEALGYPTSWCHTVAEIDAIKTHLQKGTKSHE